MDAPIEHGSRRRRRIGMVLYAVIVGAVAGILLARTIDPVVMHTGTALYLGVIVAVATMAVDTILRALSTDGPLRRRSSRSSRAPPASLPAGGHSTTPWAARPEPRRAQEVRG